MKSTWKCITLATVDYGGSIVGCHRGTALPLIISAVFFLWILVKPSIQADQQIFSTHAKHLAYKYSDRPWSLFDAHSPRQPSVSTASPAFSAPESYFPVHASYLIICPRFTLRVAAVTENNGGQTHRRKDTRTHRQTNCNNPRCACAQARVNLLCAYILWMAQAVNFSLTMSFLVNCIKKLLAIGVCVDLSPFNSSCSLPSQALSDKWPEMSSIWYVILFRCVISSLLLVFCVCVCVCW